MSYADLRNWTAEFYIANETTCNNLLQDSNALKEIPLLNSLALHDVQDGQLVRFQGMIQDMYNAEYYLKKYEVVNVQTGDTCMQTAAYKDFAKCLPGEDIVLESPQNTRGERQTYIVISIPGLNDWVQPKTQQTQTNSAHSSTITALGTKRTHVNDQDEPMDTTEPSAKKECPEKSPQVVLSKEHLLNFPIPIKNGKACIVKTYDESISFKLNQVIDIIGFISLNPSLSDVHGSEDSNDLEVQTHNPPPSLVPRLHAIKTSELLQNFDIPNAPELFSKAQAIRSDLHMVLSQFLFGDKLAADYLICHLISSIYTRKDYLCLGNFPLNITKFPINQYKLFTKVLYEVIASLVPKSYYFECTLDNLNDLSLVPKKDYDCERLTSGILQLSNNTHLVIDETNLTIGQVSASGRLNYEAISNLIKFQKLTYDFKFYTMEYDTDIPVLILSNVKSFIPCVMQVPLKTDPETEKDYLQVVKAAKQYLKDENRLNNIRQYLELLRRTDFKLGEDITDVIQEDFVRLRQSDKTVDADNLHSLMVFARLMALTQGENSLTLDCWKQTFAMENERVSRLPRRNK